MEALLDQQMLIKDDNIIKTHPSFRTVAILDLTDREEPGEKLTYTSYQFPTA